MTMTTIAYQHVLELWASVCGIAIGDVTDTQRARFNRFFNRAIRRGWNWYFWPVLCELEERWLRDAWVAGAYAAAAEVVHDGVYYVATDAVTSGDVPGVSAKWSVITELDPYVAYDQAGKTGFDHVVEIFNANPRTTRQASRLDWQYDERGAWIRSSAVSPSVWVKFRRRCPVYSGVDYSAEATYGAGQTRFYSSESTGFEGDFWTTVQSTSAGESPETHPAKWTKLEVPDFLGDFAANAAKLLELEGDAGFERAMLANGEAWAWLYDERDRVQDRSGNVRRARVANL